MNFYLVSSLYSLKKQILIVLLSLSLILSLPLVAVASLGRSVLEYLASQPTLSSATQEGFYSGPPVPGNTYAWGNCTYWVYAQRLWNNQPIPNSWGNANTWDDRAKRDGYLVNNLPVVGSIFQTDEGFWGHVAYVTQVNQANQTFTISEMNNFGLNIINNRIFKLSDAQKYSFIHQKIAN